MKDVIGWCLNQQRLLVAVCFQRFEDHGLDPPLLSVADVWMVAAGVGRAKRAAFTLVGGVRAMRLEQLRQAIA
jgi:hypothetical protein